MKFHSEVTGAIGSGYDAQLDGRVYGYDDTGKVLGNAIWSKFRGRTLIHHIETHPEHRRKGIATSLITRLVKGDRKQYDRGIPYHKIDWGMTTPEGTALKQRMDTKFQRKPRDPYVRYGVKSEALIEAVLEGVPVSSVLEAVDTFDHAHSVFRHYGYAPDPRHSKEDPKHRWYVHESGHQAFVYFDPTSGMVWNLYQCNPRQEALTGDQYTFGKGFGVNSLEMRLDLLHNQLAG